MHARAPAGTLTPLHPASRPTCLLPLTGPPCSCLPACPQLRGIQLEDADKIINGLRERGLTSFMVGGGEWRCCVQLSRAAGPPATSCMQHTLTANPLTPARRSLAWTTCATSRAAPSPALTHMSSLTRARCATVSDWRRCVGGGWGGCAPAVPRSAQVGYTARDGRGAGGRSACQMGLPPA